MDCNNKTGADINTIRLSSHFCSERTFNVIEYIIIKKDKNKYTFVSKMIYTTLITKMI